jgi:hypothetical protein
VTVELSHKTWLAELVAAELEGYDPEAAWLRLPPDLRDADADGPGLEARARMLVVRSLRRRRAVEVGSAEQGAAFLAPVQGHVALLLDLALLQGGRFDPARRRAELAAFFATAMGQIDLGVAALGAGKGGSPVEAAVRKAFVRAGAALFDLCYPPGDPADGIPLYAGTVAIHRRLLARIALSYHRKGRLDLPGVHGYLVHARQEFRLLAEALVALAAADGPLGPVRRRVILRQGARLGFSRAAQRELRERLATPPPARETARAAPARTRGFLLEQLLLASTSADGSPAREAYVTAFAEAAQVGPDHLAAMRSEAADFRAAHAHWLRDFGVPEPDLRTLAEEWEEFGDQMMQRAAGILAANLDAIVAEIRQTGELAQLLGKASVGRTLTPEEKRKVKEHLIDLAKTVPALAIFAAPGGMLLLPILAKLLPAGFWPSAFQPDGRKAPAPGTREGSSGE